MNTGAEVSCEAFRQERWGTRPALRPLSLWLISFGLDLGVAEIAHFQHILIDRILRRRPDS